jgi:hypothetical protein
VIVPFELAGEVAAILDSLMASPPNWLTLRQAQAIYEFEMMLKQQEPKEN